jgi:unsaturated pyranuronate lyase
MPINRANLGFNGPGNPVDVGDNSKGSMKVKLSDISPREIMPGFHGRFVHTDVMTFAYWTIDKDSVLPAHQHPHEQVVNMLEGELEIAAGGVTHRLRAGDVLVIPGGMVHSGRALTEVKVLDVFNPVREDYR